MKSTEKLYRLERDIDSWNFNENLKMTEYDIIKDTKSCYVISSSNKLKYILKSDGSKRFARKTKERAIECFIVRSKKRIEYLERDFKNERVYLNLALNFKLSC